MRYQKMETDRHAGDEAVSSSAGAPEGREIPLQLRTLAEKLRNGESAAPVTARELFRWFGAQRRGYYIVEDISKALASASVITSPDFREPWIDGELQFKLADAQPEAGGGTAATEETAEVGDIKGVGEIPATSAPDPTFRIGRLPTASKGSSQSFPMLKYRRRLRLCYRVTSLSSR